MAEDRNPATTLNEVREGAVKMLLVVQERLAEVGAALERGQFIEAASRCDELHNKLAHLAGAEHVFANLLRTHIVRAENVEEGMRIGSGTITSVDVQRHSCMGRTDDHVVVELKWDNGHEQSFDGDDELVVHSDELA